MMDTHHTKQLSMLNFFLAVFQTVSLTLGGGYAICPALGAIFIRNNWIDEEAYYRIVARAQTIPGPIALNTALLSGIQFFGFAGILPAFLGVALTPFFTIVLIGSFLLTTNIGFITRFLEGARFVIPGIVLSFLLKNIKSRKWNSVRIIGTLITCLFFIIFPALFIPIIVCGIAIFYLLETRKTS